MTTITLYKYVREDGGIDISPVRPSSSYTEMYRLIADADHVLVNGKQEVECIDVESIEGWSEKSLLPEPEPPVPSESDEILAMLEEIL